MANPTTVLAYAIAEQSSLKKERDDARDAALAAEKNYATARENLSKANADFAALEKDAAQIRKELAEVETPADGEELIDKLAAKIVAMRAENAKILEAEREAETARARSELAGAELKRAEALLARADAALAESDSESKQRAARIDALGKAPLSTLRQDATDALAAATFQKAKTRIETDVPQPLLDRARARRQSELAFFDLEQQVVAVANTLVATELNNNGGLGGKVEKLKAEYVRAADALRDYVGRAKERYDQALSLAARVADPENEPLTAAQSARIKDATLQQDREDAADFENARDAERDTVKEKEAEVEKAIIAARAADVDADPEADPDVITARTNLADAKALLTQAEADYLPKHRAALDTWEAAVPDPTWRQFADFEEAQRLLTDLKNTSGQTLVDQLNLVESALAAALAAASHSARTLRTLETERQKRAARIMFEAAAAPRLTFSALRGDR